MRKRSGLFLLIALTALLILPARFALAEEISMTLRFIDAEESPEPVACQTVRLYGDEGAPYSCAWGNIAGYCPGDFGYRLRTGENSLTFPLVKDGTVDIQVMRKRLFSVVCQMIDADTNEALSQKTVTKYGYKGAALNLHTYGLLPKGYALFWSESNLRLGVDTQVTLLLCKQKSYPITFCYVDADNEAIVLGESSVLFSGIEGEVVSVLPEDGLMPHGWNVSDSCEGLVRLGRDTSVTIPVRRMGTFPIRVICVNRDGGGIVANETVPCVGFAGETRHLSCFWSLPQEYRALSSLSVTLGEDTRVVVSVAKQERFAIRVTLTDHETGNEVATIAVYENGYRGEVKSLSLDRSLPDGWKPYWGEAVPSVTLGETTAYTRAVVREGYDTEGYQTFPIRVHFADLATDREIAVQTLRKRGQTGQSVWLSYNELSCPDGYLCVDGGMNDVALGLTEDVTLWVRALADYPPYDVAFIGVNAENPAEVIHTQTVSIPYDGDGIDRLGLYHYVTPPAGYRIADASIRPFCYGVTRECVYYLEPMSASQVTVRYVDQANPETVVETRISPLGYAPGSGLGLVARLQAPDGWRIVGYEDGLLECEGGIPAGPVDVPVVRLSLYSVTAELADAYTQSLVDIQTVAVQGEKDTKEKVSRQGVTCPEGYVFAAQAEPGVICGQTAAVRFLIKRDASVMRTLVLPRELTEIQASAFAGTDVQRVLLPDTLSSIGPEAFADCVGLCYVVAPDGITAIDPSAFARSPGTVLLCEEGSYAWRYATERNIPHGVE